LFDDRLPYVEATILELFRYKTVVPVIMHCTLKDTEVGGYFVPKGTMVRREYHERILVHCRKLHLLT